MPPASNNASGTTLTTAVTAGIAAAAVSAIGLLALSKRNYSSNNKGTENKEEEDNRGHFDIPEELLLADSSRNAVDVVEELKLAVDLALQAGKNIFQHCNTKGTQDNVTTEADLGISTKSNAADFATIIDVQNEQLIMHGIQSKFPTHFIIGEESVGTDSIPALSKTVPTWIIDPIDGTTNFASGLPLTAVSIGFCRDGTPIMGVIYSPMTNELYIGVKGRGAYRNGQRVSCQDNISAATTSATTTSNDNHNNNKQKELKNSIVCYEYGSARSTQSIQKMLSATRNVLTHGCRATRSLGCGVLDLCYVATGRFDVVYTGVADEGWKPWDYCAGMVIVEEAGGVIRSFYGTRSSSSAENKKDGKKSGEPSSEEKEDNNNDDNDDYDANGCVKDGSKFDIYSTSMICAVNVTLLEECRRVVLGT